MSVQNTVATNLVIAIFRLIGNLCTYSAMTNNLLLQQSARVTGEFPAQFGGHDGRCWRFQGMSPFNAKSHLLAFVYLAHYLTVLYNCTFVITDV